MELRWESILGGQGPSTHFAAKDQFRASIGIDPAQPIDDLDNIYSSLASGLIRPAASQKISGTTINSAVLWQIANPKDQYTYMLDANGSAYTMDASAVITALADGGSLSSGLGNGGEYYDNYIYFRKNTDIARYGPLNGVPAFNGTYWTGTLSKTALVNTTYPTSARTGITYPNGIMVRHSDGRLYHFDVVGNQGTVHYIKTTKSSVEGDTDNGSTYNALQFGYGLWPTAAESYGTYIAVAFMEAFNANKKDMRAKLALWDTSSTSFNSITWHEFPDQYISSIENANGVLVITSGNLNARGFRVTQYLGGYSFKELQYSETGEMPFPGAVDATLDQIMIGSYTDIPESDGCVYSIGLQKSRLGRGLFNTMRATGGTSSTHVTSLSIVNNGANSPIELGFQAPTIAWTKGTGTANNGVDQQGNQYNNAPSVIWSPLWRIGQHFTVDRIKIPLTKAVATDMELVASVYVDNGIESVTAATINITNYTKGERLIDEELALEGWNNVWVELRHQGTTICTPDLPITLEITRMDK